jgi:hypothetical protein
MNLPAISRIRLALAASSAVVLAAAGPSAAESCYADCDGSEQLDFFDFLCFQNAFALRTPYADCDESGGHDFFDFLCFQDSFAAGCPTLEIVSLGTDPAPPRLCGVEVTQFPLDTRLIFRDVTTVASPLGGELVFNMACNIRPGGCSFATCWGRGYDGKTYYTNGSPRIAIEAPPNSAFYFYMAPSALDDIEFEITAIGGGAETSIREVIDGFGEAVGFAFCGGVETVIIRATDGVSDFAFGEFSIAD